MSNSLRAAFEGAGIEPLRHIKLAARLKNEWPDLFEAIEDACYTESRPLDVRKMLALAEQIANPFITKEELRDYLDKAIRSWREIAANADHKYFDIAPYYVDAFQTVRLALLDETLGLDDD